MQGTDVVSIPLLDSKLGVHDPQIGPKINRERCIGEQKPYIDGAKSL